jgi:hypothetical protein
MSKPIHTPHLSKELQFVVTCCQVNPSEKDQEEYILSYLKTNHTKVDDLISLSYRHGVLPLVYKTILALNADTSVVKTKEGCKSLSSHAVVLPLLKKLQPEYMRIAQRNMLMSAELIRIMKLLEDNGIEALAFKGPTLAQMAYGDITLRQYCDLDIYVHKSDITHVGQILEEDKYDSRVDLKFFNNDAFLNVNSDVQFYRENNSMLIEMHWTVFRSTFSQNMKNLDLWNDTEKIYIQNQALSTFKTEILLLYLCMHGSKHIWERIEWIADIDKLIRAKEYINWNEVYKLAHRVDGVTMLKLGLLLSHQIFDTPLNEQIKNSLTSNKKNIYLYHNVLTLLNQEKNFQETELERNYKHLRFHLSLRDTMQSKFYFILKTLLPLKSSDVELINLPKSLFFIYYLLRPFRLMGKYIQKVFTKD